ncbi:hypothetical protein ABBQ38_001921 [Trebouxia sp. C0009 RCD-2024]
MVTAMLTGARSTLLSAETRQFCICHSVKALRQKRHRCLTGPIAIATVTTQALTGHLRGWIEEHGGYIHPDVTLSNSPSFGCRGVVTTEDIGEELVSQEPLLLVPEELSITTSLAKERLHPLFQAAGLPDLQDLDAVLPLALFLAHEHNKGQGSFWQPYLDLLPQQPGCAWLMPPAELADAVKAVQQLVGDEASDWDLRVLEAQQAVTIQARALAGTYGGLLNVSTDDVLWGMGQVLSRCFGQEPDLAMLPFTDLCNHSCHAMAPNSYVGTEDGKPFVFVSSIWDDQPRPLAVGDELFISYMANTPPLTAFLNLGFVPEELLAPPLR